MNVRCLLVNPDGYASVVYCPGRSDIEMNQKIRSIFHFCPSVFMSRALDHRSDVWYGKLSVGEYNKLAMPLLGKPVRGVMLIVTRGEALDISSQRYVDTDWNRITTFLSEDGRSNQSPIEQQTMWPPKQEQQKQHIHIGDPSLNTISKNTSMGSSISVTQNPPVEEEQDITQKCLVQPEETTRAYTGEGAFTYKPKSVLDSITVSATFFDVTPDKATSRIISHEEHQKMLKDTRQHCYQFAQYGKCDNKECPYIHIVRGIAYPIPQNKEASENDEEEEDAEEEVEEVHPKRKTRKSRDQNAPVKKRRRSSRLAKKPKESPH